MTTHSDITVIDMITRIHDVDETTAGDLLETYLGQMEQVDGREIDRDEIPADDVDFVLEAIKQAHSAGDLGHQELAAVEETALAYDDATHEMETARQLRDRAIIAAKQAGAPIKEIAAAAGITRQAVDYVIKNARR